MKQKFAIVASVFIALVLIVVGLPAHEAAGISMMSVLPLGLLDIEKSIRSLKEQRGTELDAMDVLVDLGLTEKRDLTEAEDTVFIEHRSKAKSLKNQIDRLEGSLESRKLRLKDEGKKLEDTEGRTDAEKSEKRYQEAFRNWAISGEVRCSKEDLDILDQKGKESRALGTGAGATGGYLAPTTMAGKIEEALKFLGGVRSGANVITTDNGNVINYPTMDDTNNIGELIGENPAGDTKNQDITFGNKVIGAFTYSSKAIVVSNELLADSGFDLEGYIAKVAAQRIFKITNLHFTIGDGTDKPKGLVLDAAQGLVAAAAAAITGDELIKLLHKVDVNYRTNGKWMFNDQTLLAIRLLKDSDGNTIWQKGLSDGEPDKILGKPFIINNDMPNIGASAKSIMFGDIEKYLIRDVSNATLKRLDQVAGLQNQTVFVLFSRHDGKLIDAGSKPVKYLEHPAA